MFLAHPAHVLATSTGGLGRTPLPHVHVFSAQATFVFAVDGSEQPLFVTISDGLVRAVSDRSILLADLREPTRHAIPTAIVPPAVAPTGAVGRCVDGTYFVSGENCDGRSGIDEKYIYPVAASSAPDAIDKCGHRIRLSDWNSLSSAQQSAVCPSPERLAPADPAPAVRACARPASVAVEQWNRMTAPQQAAACQP
jgi:hypothetical protein